MKVETMNDLFIDMLKDAYDAEKQLINALPKMAQKASSDSLKKVLNDHLKVTEKQRERLDKIGSMLKVDLGGVKCPAMEGNIKEAEILMSDVKDNKVLDAAIIAAAQKAEHYEIATYGTLTTFAKDLGYKEAQNLLHEILEEEKATDKQLSDLAQSRINQRAEQAAGGSR